MLSTSSEFPLRREDSPFGPIVDLRIILQVQTTAGYRGHRFLVDTGADLSVAPRSIAREVGLDWDRLPNFDIVGVGPGRVAARLGTLTVRIAEIDLAVRCLFMDQGLNPFILGRADVLERLALTIDAGQGKIVFTEIA